MVILRNIANQANQDVGWDKATGSVSVGGSSYTPQQLQGMGGQLVNNQWSVPDSIANRIVGKSPQGLQQAKYAQQKEIDNMGNTMQDMSDSYLQQQSAQLDNARNSQLTELKMAYEQAIADGQISERDAQAEFQAKAKEVEKQAYTDADKTALYGQDMGIQNSQQMIGLMQGDNERKNNLINQNMSTRDKRVSDIRDRLNAVKKQKDLDISRVNSEYDNGLLQAKGEANQMYANNMFGFMSDNYSANRDQRFTQENMEISDDLQRGQMALGQQYTEKNMETELQNSLKQATHDSGLAIERMNVQQGLDLQKMSQALKDDITKMNIQFGQSSALQSQSHANSMASAQANYSNKVNAEEQAYQKQLARDLKGVTPGTTEYKVIEQNNAREFKNNLTKIHNNTVYEYTVKNTLENAPTVAPKKPFNWSTGSNDIGGNIMNSVTGYTKNKSSYDSQTQAIKNKNALLKTTSKYLPS